ncbi:MAG: HAD family hydrolase [Comamonas sp.]|jgi:phosphoglycolate phosphatase-like HAD superfamily hydrolase|uniref:HAD family hydrolase n=1 Tax=Comamonas sp. TaxID=34028 RepID=UPI0028259F93|nr:HAD family hydrolase [Comamonas sp.]MDR0214589.1 HAD family hydrolase [Comamonas sp.]
MNSSKLIALDADGVLLDYNLAYATAWQRAFGERPALRNPQAYWAMERWDVPQLGPALREQFRAVFDVQFWSTVPALAGAVDACHRLRAAGFELVCVSALQPQYAKARLANLRSHGFPIEQVVATSNDASGSSPKACALAQLQPVAFVDDYLPYFHGVPESIHKALVLREPHGSPNTGPALAHIQSTHGNLAGFVDWWLDKRPLLRD